MIGMDANTGKQLGGFDHLLQSVRDILTTRLGSRVMRRDYGSRLPELVDKPLNNSTKLDLYGATVEALAKWEPRLSVKSVSASSAGAGQVVIGMTATYLPDGQAVRLDGIVIR